VQLKRSLKESMWSKSAVFLRAFCLCSATRMTTWRGTHVEQVCCFPAFFHLKCIKKRTMWRGTRVESVKAVPIERRSKWWKVKRTVEEALEILEDAFPQVPCSWLRICAQEVVENGDSQCAPHPYCYTCCTAASNCIEPALHEGCAASCSFLP
jgi:hypothetical protein